MSQSNSPARWRALAQVVTVMALMVAVIAALGTAAGPAHAVPLGQCDGPCPTQTTPPPPPPPRGCFDCNSGATKPKPKPKLVTVYHRSYAYSTPYLNARTRHPVRPTTYVATCEAYSSSAGRYGNRWWSRMREGTWVNNGDLRGGVKMGIGDCAAPPNDGQPRGGRRGCDDCSPRASKVLPTCPDSHGSRIPAPASSPLPHTHAHNDYQHEHPLFDALSHGFSSVEADIWLDNDGRLLVGHGKNTLRYPKCTLQALYLDPLLALVRRHGGHVYAGSAAPLQLLVDVKSMGTKTVLTLDRLFRERYASMLTSWSSGVEHPGAIRIVISGNRDPALMEFKPQRYAAYDGGWCELLSGAPANVARHVARLCKKPPRGGGAAASLIPLISINWASVFTWKGGRDKMPANERVLLRAIVARAHSHGQQVRFWNTPDRYPFWQAELDAGVDWLNADNLCALEAFLARCPTEYP